MKRLVLDEDIEDNPPPHTVGFIWLDGGTQHDVRFEVAIIARDKTPRDDLHFLEVDALAQMDAEQFEEVVDIARVFEQMVSPLTVLGQQ
jgi:hypothetical protein